MRNYQRGRFLLTAILFLGGCGNSGSPAPNLLPLPLSAHKKPASSQKKGIWIDKIGQIPSAVRSRIPRGGQSKFYGEAKIPSHSRDLLLHFYSLRAKSNLYCFDIFLVGDKSRNHPRLLHSILFKYSAFADAPMLRVVDSVNAEILWINPSKQDKPVVRLDCFANGFYGPFGNNFLIVFPKGFGGKSIIQQFSYSGDHNMANQVDFDQIDKRGLMMVTITTDFNDGNNQPPQISKLKWNGKIFK